MPNLEYLWFSSIHFKLISDNEYGLWGGSHGLVPDWQSVTLAIFIYYFSYHISSLIVWHQHNCISVTQMLVSSVVLEGFKQFHHDTLHQNTE